MTQSIRFISAGAGSGKTYRLTRELESLLGSGAVRPAGVIATTFTNRAASELRERVRARLIAGGAVATANQMGQALIGTVNSICGELLRRFAFEAGLPPDQKVLEELEGDRLFAEAIEQALEGQLERIRVLNAVVHRLQLKEERTGSTDWRFVVREIASQARENNLAPEALIADGAASAESLLAYFPAPVSRGLDTELSECIESALRGLATTTDTTAVTQKYIAMMRSAQAGLRAGRLSWPEWIKLARDKPGAKSIAVTDAVRMIAADYERHPQLRADISQFCHEVFAVAADALATYQAMKAARGLLDFVDQEQRLYQLLDHPAVAETVAAEMQVLMVDEFQDTSPIQLALFVKLSRLVGRAIWVGDVKQSIYGFRGADPELMRAVLARVVDDGHPPEILEQSWRSRPGLVRYVNNLFVPAFSNSLPQEQVALVAARSEPHEEPLLEHWELNGSNKGVRAGAVARGIRELVESQGRRVVDKHTEQLRALAYGDIAVLCRTHVHLGEVAGALVGEGVPIRYKRVGLLSTPEGRLAVAMLRRLADPGDTLASAEIRCLVTCEEPETWLVDRLTYLQADMSSHNWGEGEEGLQTLRAIAGIRERMSYLTPVEALRCVLQQTEARRIVAGWQGGAHGARHRINNLESLLALAEQYLEHCHAQSLAATVAGLILWLQERADTEEDWQAESGAGAVQLVTHHGAKGLEWPVVVAMDLDSTTKSRIWGLRVLANPSGIDMDSPLAGRSLGYWPPFFGQMSKDIPIKEAVEVSDEGLREASRAFEESKRLLYVSLTRARDLLVLPLGGKIPEEAWMGVLDAPWMLTHGDSLELPDGSSIPARYASFVPDDSPPGIALEELGWPIPPYSPGAALPPRTLSPSSTAPRADARVTEVIELGSRLPLGKVTDVTLLGTALHAVIATHLINPSASGIERAEGILAAHGLQDVISAADAAECASRLMTAVQSRFAVIAWHVEAPVIYRNDVGQAVSGWIDAVVETPDGWVLIDHKASPKSRREWEATALGYSGQLACYAEGIQLATRRPVVASMIHFPVSGGLICVG